MCQKLCELEAGRRKRLQQSLNRIVTHNHGFHCVPFLRVKATNTTLEMLTKALLHILLQTINFNKSSVTQSSYI